MTNKQQIDMIVREAVEHSIKLGMNYSSKEVLTSEKLEITNHIVAHAVIAIEQLATESKPYEEWMKNGMFLGMCK